MNGSDKISSGRFAMKTNETPETRAATKIFKNVLPGFFSPCSAYLLYKVTRDAVNIATTMTMKYGFMIFIMIFSHNNFFM
ncbi:hypothetical protein NY2A_b654L [Paramecium bursaria Chlorella virus NY2A]|uniref:Uncharacterized protein b654L n=1 Tax=Paramecium bursaria Chlorella virus NY2A TaxID=46021 RepID=A7IXH9_PBCVN|nr:hypothetical protein NY2A_b654L [Paramecium bursaria Chlorella virus NY2A]ABT15053.1 hypothetical protein NY2A_b654L [Paramecium bursaria Chlorella virus NY2A]